MAAVSGFWFVVSRLSVSRFVVIMCYRDGEPLTQSNDLLREMLMPLLILSHYCLLIMRPLLFAQFSIFLFVSIAFTQFLDLRPNRGGG